VLCGAFGMILSVNRQLDKQDAQERQQREAAAEQLTEEYNPDTTSTTDNTAITYTTSHE
jgi:hypothetical protein